MRSTASLKQGIRKMATGAKSMAGGGWRSKPLVWKLGLGRLREDQMLLVLALLIGALTGLAVVGFILLTERLGGRLYPIGSAAWRRVLIPILGSATMGYVVFRYFPDARGSGVMATKAALFAREGVITARTTFGKFFCTAATLASGIPLGPEGPSVQVGGGLASVLARNLGLTPAQVKALVPAGAAAAIAAAFNTPMAAVVFALEEIIGDRNAPVLGGVVLASGASWLVLRLLLGNNPLFHVPRYELAHPIELAFYAVLGLTGGLVSVAFTQTLLRLRKWFLKLPRWSVWLQPVTGGVVAGLIAWRVPQVLGVGYSYVGDALNGRMALEIMALLVVLKIVAVTTSYASGNAGGIFAPSLFIGAMFGGTVGSVAHHLARGYTAAPGAYALVGMGTLFAGIIRAPMTSVLMIFETTQDYAVIVPVMISNLISYFVASQLQPDSIYEELARQDGIHLPGARGRSTLSQAPVASVLRPGKDVIRANATAEEAVSRAHETEFGAWLVMDDQGLIGVVTVERLEQESADNRKKPLAEFADELKFPHVHLDHPLYMALERMGKEKLQILPVVSRVNVRQMLGVVTLPDVLNSYGLEHSEAERLPSTG